MVSEGITNTISPRFKLSSALLAASKSCRTSTWRKYQICRNDQNRDIVKKEKCALSLLSLWKYMARDTYIQAVNVHIRVSIYSLWNRYSFSKSSWNSWKKPSILSQGCRIPQVLPLGQVLLHHSYRARNFFHFPLSLPDLRRGMAGFCW